jgi:thioredoxin 1
MKKVLKFEASWCEPCKMLTRTLSHITTDIPIEVVDIDQNRDIAIKYGVRGVPTLIMLEDDKEVRRKVGALMRPELERFLNDPA